MYNGIKRKRKTDYKIKYDTKVQQIVIEETETNGIISQQYKVKTIDYKADPNIKYTDFEINNLKAAGININAMQETRLTPNIEKIANNAEQANLVMDRIELINQYEQQLKQHENGTEQSTTETK